MPDRAEQLDQAIDEMLEMLIRAPKTESADIELSRLVEIAGALREMPDDEFKMRLSRELQAEFQRRPPMTMSTRVESAAEAAAIHNITPFITVAEGDKLIEFMKQTFDAVETSRHAHGPDGFVAVIRIADSDVLVMGGESLRGQESLAALHVYVKDCDATYQRALDAGAVLLAPGFGEPADRPYGERSAFVSDPFGSYWFIATRFGPNYVGEGLKHVTPSLLPLKAAPVIDFLERAFGAKVEGVVEHEGRMMHAFVRIGEAMMEMGEAEEQLRPFGFYLHTDNVDALYHRAVAAGGVSILPPADQLYGERLAIVQDPAGNRWFAAKRLE